MSCTRAFGGLLVVCCAAAAALAACGGTSTDTSSGDEPGAGGASGSGAGAAGKASGGAAGKASGGASGKAGSAQAGTSGVGGAAGNAGNAGASGAGAAAGGAAGSAGASGASGAAGKAGNGGGGAAGASGASGAAGKAGNGGASGGAAGSAGAGGAVCANPISLVVLPSSAKIDVVNGASAPVTFEATGVCANGATSKLTAAWSFDALDIATVTPGSGVVTAVGNKGGKGVLTAKVGSLTATADVTVSLTLTANPGGVSPGDQTKLDTPTGAGASGPILYPYDKTVFARGLLAPEIMWDAPAAGATYLVRVKEDFVDAKFYVSAPDANGRYLMSEPIWGQLLASNHGEDVKVSITKLENGAGQQPTNEVWKIAQGSLRGTIFYWSVNQGRVLKIAPGSDTPVPVFNSGSATQLGTPAPLNPYNLSPPWQANNAGDRCIACHTVSKDGTTLASIFSRQDSTGPFGTVDIPTGNVNAIGDYGASGVYMALSPSAKYLVLNTAGFRLQVSDAKTAAAIGTPLDGFSDNTADPVFSPDGKKLAFASFVDGAYPVEYSASGLDVIDFDEASGAIGNRKTVLGKGSTAIAFPSFTPGSDMIVYQKGDYSRANYGAGLHGADDLYVTDLAGALGELRLGVASGDGELDAKSAKRSYEPRVNPIAVGGYVWVVFVSPRDYGNRMRATTDASYDNHKQLWVTAIDLNPKPGQDPSHPAFYLRGQEFGSTNMSGYWTLAACQSKGASCEEGFECCTGFCRPDGAGKLSCSDPPVNQCSKVGEKCVGKADCCVGTDDVDCIGGFCALAKPLLPLACGGVPTGALATDARWLLVGIPRGYAPSGRWCRASFPRLTSVERITQSETRK